MVDRSTAGFRAGLRIGASLAGASFVLAVTFGATVQAQGWGVLAPIVCSVLVFSGSAQFALATALAGGGGVAPAIASAALINARFLPMGVAEAAVMTLWFAILAVAVISFAIKAAGPLFLTGRELPAWTTGVIALLAPALLAALVVVHVLGDNWTAVHVPVLVGLAAVVLAHLLRAPMLVSVLIGVAATAALRALTGL